MSKISTMPDDGSRMPNAKQVKAITLDVGNTLIHPFPSLGDHYARAAAHSGILVDREDIEARFHQAWQLAQGATEGLIYGRTHAEARAFWRNVIGRVFSPDGADASQVMAMLDELYEEFGQARTWRLAEGWTELFEACGSCGVRIGLISNWDMRLRKLLDEIGVLENVHSVVISAECGIEKPTADIFHLSLAELGVAPAETVHVGDTWLDDVVGARNAGMMPVWFNPSERAFPDGEAESHQARSLTDLIHWLGLC